jgi:hypothetical protein
MQSLGVGLAFVLFGTTMAGLGLAARWRRRTQN